MFCLRLVWDVVETYWWDFVVTSPWDVPTKFQWRRLAETSQRRSTKTLLGASFEKYVRRCWNVQREVGTTLPRRFLAECDFLFKDTVPETLHSNCVYKFSCKNYIASYINKTYRNIKVRISEYQSNFSRWREPVKGSNISKGH